MSDIERRFIPLEQVELRSSGNESEPTMFAGYAARHNSLSQDLGGFNEVLRFGVFAKSLELKRDVIANVDHNSNSDGILARVSAGTLTLTEDQHGLFSEWPIDLELPAARQLQLLIRKKLITGMSFAFRRPVDSFRQEGDKIIREITDLELIDVAAVTTPAYLATSISLRSLNEWQKSQEQPFQPNRWLDHRLKLYEMN